MSVAGRAPSHSDKTVAARSAPGRHLPGHRTRAAHGDAPSSLVLDTRSPAERSSSLSPAVVSDPTANWTQDLAGAIGPRLRCRKGFVIVEVLPRVRTAAEITRWRSPARETATSAVVEE